MFGNELANVISFTEKLFTIRRCTSESQITLVTILYETRPAQVTSATTKQLPSFRYKSLETQAPLEDLQPASSTYRTDSALQTQVAKLHPT